MDNEEPSAQPPMFQVNQAVVFGLFVLAVVVAAGFAAENQKLRQQALGRKPCGCQDHGNGLRDLLPEGRDDARSEELHSVETTDSSDGTSG